MPGGLLQLVGVGAQNELVNGNPSMTHFRAVYRRHTNFAMEHIRMTFGSSNLQFDATGPRTISCRIDRYAQMLHDTYLVLTLPDIYSPLFNLNGAAPPPGIDPASTAIGYEFKWIENIGYNLIDHVDITMNGQAIQSLRGEWLKFYSYLTHNGTKRAIVDQMIGNVPEMNDPANAYDRMGQYPHAVAGSVTPSVAPMTTIPEPSIRSRQLVIPLHFWFAENPGVALPLVSIQNSEVSINVTFRALNNLYTVIDVDHLSPTYGHRVRPNNYPMSRFLSPPLADGSLSNPTLTTFFPDPYLEGNFIYLTEMEMAQLAKADQTCLIKTVRYVGKEGQYGANSDLELPMFNLVTRIVFACQRSDKIINNDWDNYTNWDNPKRAPFTSMITGDPMNSLYSSGQTQVTSVFPQDPVIDGVLLLDGKERFSVKPNAFFSLLQMYKHVTGAPPAVIPGVHMYSFSIDHDSYQPSGAINGSMFNKIILRLTLQQPLPLSTSSTLQTVVTILKSSAFSANPVVIPPADCILYTPDQLLTVVQNAGGDNIIFTFTYSCGAYVESMNFLRIVSGTANLVFAS